MPWTISMWGSNKFQKPKASLISRTTSRSWTQWPTWKTSF
jgi:hypothetical protein